MTLNEAITLVIAAAALALSIFTYITERLRERGMEVVRVGESSFGGADREPGPRAPHRHPGGFGISQPYRVTINKHDIFTGEMIINGGTIR